MKEIPLVNGKGIALVDDEDYELVSGYRWRRMHYNSEWTYVHGYSCANNKNISMHRLITGAQPGQQVDHINHNGLDNRRSNLRVCTPSENQHNSKLRKDNKSGYKGVSWNKGENKWSAKIRNKNNRKHLGNFDDLVEAARAYDTAARELFGEFAYLNFPDNAVVASA